MLHSLPLIRQSVKVQFKCNSDFQFLCSFEEMDSALMICTSLSLSTVYRDRHLLPSALSVQEEEHEAHRHCDAAGGPARYERVEVAQLRADAVD